MDNLLRLQTVSRALDQAGITWWIDHGTLLGVIRDSRLLPWDEDIDLSVFSRDLGQVYQALLAVKPLLSAHLIRTHRNVKIIPFSPGDKTIDLGSYRNSTDPLFYKKTLVEFPRRENLLFSPLRKRGWRSCRKLERKLLTRNKKRSAAAGKTSGYEKIINAVTFLREKMGTAHSSQVPVEFFTSFTRITWRELELPAPRDPEAYLHFRYGENWRTPISNWKWWRDDMSLEKTEASPGEEPTGGGNLY